MFHIALMSKIHAYGALTKAIDTHCKLDDGLGKDRIFRQDTAYEEHNRKGV